MSLDDEIRLVQSTVQKAMPIIDATMRQQATLSILSDAAARAAPDYSAFTSIMAEVVENNRPRLQQEVASLLSSMEDMQPHLSTQALSGMTAAMDMQPGYSQATISAVANAAEMQPKISEHALSMLDSSIITGSLQATISEVSGVLDAHVSAVPLYDSIADIGGTLQQGIALNVPDPSITGSLQATISEVSGVLDAHVSAAPLYDSIAHFEGGLHEQAFNVLRAVENMPQVSSAQVFNVVEAAGQLMPTYGALISDLHEAVQNITPDYTTIFPDVFEMVEAMRPDFEAFSSRVLSGIEIPRVDYGLLVSSLPETTLFDISSVLSLSQVSSYVEAPADAPATFSETWAPNEATPARLVVVISHRYHEYRHGHERLGAMTYAVINLLQESAGGPREAASKYKVSENLLQKMRRLSSTRGSYLTARKFATGTIPQEFSEGEVAWMEAALEALVGHLQSLASSRMESLPILTLDDLPVLRPRA